MFCANKLSLVPWNQPEAVTWDVCHLIWLIQARSSLVTGRPVEATRSFNTRCLAVLSRDLYRRDSAPHLHWAKIHTGTDVGHKGRHPLSVPRHLYPQATRWNWQKANLRSAAKKLPKRNSLSTTSGSAKTPARSQNGCLLLLLLLLNVRAIGLRNTNSWISSRWKQLRAYNILEITSR